jgi:hypothetical protein
MVGAVTAVVLLAGGGAIVAAGGIGDDGKADAEETVAAPAVPSTDVPTDASTGEPPADGSTEVPPASDETTEPELVEGAGADELPPPTEGRGDTTVEVIQVVVTEPEVTTVEDDEDEPGPPTTTGRTPPPPTTPVTVGGGDGDPPVTTSTPQPPTTTDTPPPTVTDTPQPPTTDTPPPTTVEPPPAVPNLVVAGISGQRVVGAAATVVWTVTVSNVGTGPAGASSVAFAHSFGGASASIGALSPGGSQTVTFQTPCRTSVSGTATADARGAVAESNEGDNAQSATVSCVN